MFGWEFPSVVDPDRQLAGKVGAAYQPLYVLLDEHGRIVARGLGDDDPQYFEEMAAALPDHGS